MQQNKTKVNLKQYRQASGQLSKNSGKSITLICYSTILQLVEQRTQGLQFRRFMCMWLSLVILFNVLAFSN